MITRREQQIIDRWEAGLSVRTIAKQLGLAETYVKHTVAYLCTGLGIDRKAERQMVKGSRQLLTAIEKLRAA